MIYHSEWEYYDDDTQFLSSDTIFVISKDIHGYVLIKKKYFPEINNNIAH